MVDAPRIRLSNHLIERARTRAPDVDLETLRGEVSAGLAAGRRSKTIPRWAQHPLRGRTKIARQKTTSRFVWNEELTRVYAVMPITIATRPPAAGWLVMTVIARACPPDGPEPDLP